MNCQIYKPENILNEIKKNLLNGVVDRYHGFHTPVFSSLKNNNIVNSRVVVLRNFESTSMKINFHSDLRSKKIEELKKNPNTFFLFYDYKIKTQLRITTKSKIHYNNDITLQAWDKTKLSSRKCYLSLKAPSTESKNANDGLPKHLIGVDPTAEESIKGYKNFVVISSEIKKIDWLYLLASGHKRLKIKINKKKNEFQWLIP
tara:strand:+ start:50 stop:655 length:606 start_codon:yes stop_codon:yes gene_type:complete